MFSTDLFTKLDEDSSCGRSLKPRFWKKRNRMKLEMELVPKPLWRKTVAKLLPRYRWSGIRNERICEKGERCEICNSSGPVQLHEVWRYDDERYIQRLDGFILLCIKCHSVKHWVRTNLIASRGQVDLQELRDHFCRVNQCGPEVLKEHEKESLAKWRERSRHKWIQNLGQYQ